jgi:hypothetical protein
LRFVLNSWRRRGHDLTHVGSRLRWYWLGQS